MNKTMIKELLYNNDLEKNKAFLHRCTDDKLLHLFAYNYNWGNGFEIPNIIINHPSCTLSTALTMFYAADGFRYLMDKSEDYELPDWLSFITYLYESIMSGKFKTSDISFHIPLTKVQVFKLKKLLSTDEEIFVSEIQGNDFDISL